MRNFFSRLAGGFVGGFTGFFAGAFLGAGYYCRLLKGAYAIGPFVGLLFGFFAGAIKHTVKGVYKGATEGLKAGFFYPRDVYSQYFSVIDDNYTLKDYILRKSPVNKITSQSLLNSSELVAFELHIQNVNSKTT